MDSEIKELPENVDLTGFLDYLNTPTTHDNVEAVEVSDFEDLDPEAQTAQTAQTAQPEQTAQPAQPAQKKSFEKSAKAVVKGVDFLHGILLAFLAKNISKEDEEARTFRATKQEQTELAEMLSEIFEDDNIKINPKWLFVLLFAYVYISKTIDAVKASKNGSLKKPDTYTFESNNQSNSVPVSEVVQVKRGRGRPKKNK